ncbi:MAG: DJ-1/PfpI family protein [Pseudomonadota bacterium]
MIDRRTFGLGLALGLIPAEAARVLAADNHAGAGHGGTRGAHDMGMVPPEWKGDEQIVFLGYDGMTALDLIGPQYMLANLWGATVKIVAKTREPLRTDTGVMIVPDQVFAEVPADLDVICVPGSVSGALQAMESEETLSFLADRGSRARYVTSVCTGTLLLGQAGLVDGYRVTSHWLMRDLMTEFGAIPVDERVVRDRNRITGGGVTAGIDFGLAMLAEMREPAYAQAVQLLAEYAPAPPFNAGTPATAPAEATEMMTAMFAGFPDRVRAMAAKRIR